MTIGLYNEMTHWFQSHVAVNKCWRMFCRNISSHPNAECTRVTWNVAKHPATFASLNYLRGQLLIVECVKGPQFSTPIVWLWTSLLWPRWYRSVPLVGTCRWALWWRILTDHGVRIGMVPSLNHQRSGVHRRLLTSTGHLLLEKKSREMTCLWEINTLDVTEQTKSITQNRVKWHNKPFCSEAWFGPIYYNKGNKV